MHEVVDELSSLGLSAEVLDDMLTQRNENAPQLQPVNAALPEFKSVTPSFMFEQHNQSAAVNWISKIPHESQRRRKTERTPLPLKLNESNVPGTIILSPRGNSRVSESPVLELASLTDHDKGMELVNLPPILVPEHDSPTFSGFNPGEQKNWTKKREMLSNSPVGSLSIARSKGDWIEGQEGRRVLTEYHVHEGREGLESHLVFYVQSPDSTSSGSEPISSPLSLIKSETPEKINHIELPSGESENSSSKLGYHTRRIVVPLAADKRFFSAINIAVANLIQAQSIQQSALVDHVRALGDTIAIVASPQYDPEDMYLWREVFSLWLEHEIFESTKEVDRGELSVSETESRLMHYVRELQKRGYLALESTIPTEELGVLDHWKVQTRMATSPFHDERSAASLEHFLRLNVALVALKRFQRASIEALRKILKKHEKQTALHAHISVARFFPDQELLARLSQQAQDGSYEHQISMLARQIRPSSTVSFLSLPRIVATMLTEQLLPVLPSVDDYSCPICMSIAWQPIRLDCSHLFCIRCLVKLQKQGSPDCPICRAPGVVQSADRRNLDTVLMTHLLKWFPSEVDEKTVSNREERILEEEDEKKYIRQMRVNRLLRRRLPEWHSQHEGNRGDRGRQCVIN